MTHASLFSGIGGAEIAASWCGWKNVFHCDINEFGNQVIRYWFPESIQYYDIKKTDFREWKGKIDVLTGGFPCQPFSQAGKRKGSADDRYLWPNMLRAICEIQPTWVVAENVAGITSMVEPGEEIKVGKSNNLFDEGYYTREEQQFTIDRICKDFESAGYSVQTIIIPACAVGAPHRRDRVWFIANTESAGSKGELFMQPKEIQSIRQNSGNIQTRWENFPTQSPVCRRHDGLPFNVDDLTIPYTKWREESIKAYGNAWVPQVAYEIFKTINILSNNN